MIYLLPWVEYPVSIIDHIKCDWKHSFYLRKAFGKEYEKESYGEIVVATSEGELNWFYSSGSICGGRFKTAKGAMKAADRQIVKYGYRIIKKCKVDRFKNKLALLL